MYKYYNNNPLNNHIDDCTIRAISLLENKSWNETYDELSRLANRDALMMDSVVFVEKYLDERYPRICYNSKTVEEFVNEHKNGKYAITMVGHITPLIDGTIYDTFNPTLHNRLMRCAWKIE